MNRQQDHAALARRLWEAGARGDPEPFYALYAPGAVLRVHGHGIVSGEHKGVDAILDFLARCGESVDELCSDLLEVYASDGGAVMRYRTLGERGGRHLDLEYLYVLRIQDQRIVEADLVPTDRQRSDEFWSLD